MTGPVNSAGTRIYISSDVVSQNIASAFDALSWTQINGVRLAGEIGNIWQTRDNFLIQNNYINKTKTAIVFNTMPLEVFTLSGDIGQSLLQQASTVFDNYSFKVERSDGGIRYFTGQVTKYLEGQGGGGKQLFDAIASIDPQAAIVFA